MRWPNPFGKKQADFPDATSDTVDPNYLAPAPTTPIALPVLTSNPYDTGEVRRMAKGEPERTHQEILDAVHGRPQGQRQPPPHARERVRFRRDEWGDLEPATVIRVQGIQHVPDDSGGLAGIRTRGPGDPADPNMLINRGNDPMPLVLLMTDDGLYTWTREARVRGACGWTR